MRYEVTIAQKKGHEGYDFAESVTGRFDTLRMATIFIETIMDNFDNVEVAIKKIENKEETANGVAV